MRLSAPAVAPHGIFSLLIAAALLHTTQGTIVLKTNDYSFGQLPDLPAGFGPPIPSPNGVEGLLVVADPEDGCSPLKEPAVGRQPWIALMTRSQRVHTNCTFDAKVRHGEAAGAVAVIVYDDTYEPLVVMSKPLGAPSPGIPSVFISQKSGLIVKKLSTPGVTVAYILPVTDEVWISVLMSAFSGAIAVGVMLATFYFIRRHRLQALGGRGGLADALLRGEEQGGLTAAELRGLPVVIYEPPLRRTRSRPPPESGGGGSNGGGVTGSSGGNGGEREAALSVEGSASSSDGGSPRGPKGGGTLKTCAVCIEDYADGDKQRVLPCQHRFHMECIDQWLSARRPLCPICKWDASQPFPNSAAAAAVAEAAAPEAPGFLTRRWRRWRWRRARRHTGIGIPLGEGSGSGGSNGGNNGGGAAGEADLLLPDTPQTPHNFPGMHFARRSSSSLAIATGGGEISAAPEGEAGAPAAASDVAIDIGRPATPAQL